MNNKEKVANMYKDIHASEALFRKVRSMNKKEFGFRNVMKYAVTTAAAAAFMFFASNGVCYAATGESLTTKISLLINGEEQEADVVWTADEEGVYGELEVNVEEGDDVYFEITDVIAETTVSDVTPDENQAD